MESIATFIASLRADARAEQRERQRRKAWQDAEAPEVRLFVLPGGDLTVDPHVDPELFDACVELFGEPMACDYRGTGWRPLESGRKRERTPFC